MPSQWYRYQKNILQLFFCKNEACVNVLNARTLIWLLSDGLEEDVMLNENLLLISVNDKGERALEGQAYWLPQVTIYANTLEFIQLKNRSISYLEKKEISLEFLCFLSLI